MLLSPRNWSDLEAWFDHHLSVAARFRARSFSFAEEILETCGALEDVPVLLRAAERPFAAEIEHIVRELANGDEPDLQAIQPKAAALVMLRFETVQGWLQTMRTRRDTPGPFAPIPYPDRESEELLGWLLLEWWDEHGRQIAADELALRYRWISP